MPLLGKKYSDYCDRPAQDCANHASCDDCPEAEHAAELKKQALEEESKEE